MSNPQVIRKVEKNIINPADMIDYGNQFIWNTIDKARLPTNFNINAISCYKNPSNNVTTVIVGGSINNAVCIAYTTTFGTSNEWMVIDGLLDDSGFISSIVNDGLGEFIFVGKYSAASGGNKGFVMTCNVSNLTTNTNYTTISFETAPLLSIVYNSKNNEYAAVGENGYVYIIKPSTSTESGILYLKVFR